ncbi:MAG: DASS family sodium-coupled anion symporter [Gammaproteobacteria bacterium]|nr:DASS family sodium-coupled anion symporter [Gammaproteobacteria bacterium]MBU1554026.1 DASS family sodium-coupled anion symporter [Gammaproteobacteria bacterium]MBU2072594.1 DASS family sodium-coupled anion symporter [Gammaproteobacteria bacterium]MBU2185055.1 DASS family sodium-coupled anion symporter [Gammaproteobacteria bacterium]MBU2207148.1 DASS family sodium-coupled anion symporter [Gammaproteobacteria bacterium]
MPAQLKLPYYVTLLAGPLLFLLTLLSPPWFAGMSENAWLITGLSSWMALWWITEPVPIPVTALLPIAIVPLLSLDTIANVTAPYAHPLIFLFLGGFVLSIAMERWNLHKRIALMTMLLVGSKPSQQVAGIMLVTAFLSMWMSNTATAVMMLPIGLSIIAMQQEQGVTDDNFAKAILLAIAYAASIGGVATLIGTPPNALLAAYLERSYQIQLSFSDWMLFGVPLSVSLLLVCWFWLTQLHFRLDNIASVDSRSLYRKKLAALGAMHNAEKLVLTVFLLAATCWMLRKLLSDLSGIKLDDTLIAICAASLLFILPVSLSSGQRILQWEDCQKLPWGVLLLFGGGLTLASQIDNSGLSAYIAAQIGQLGHINLVMLIVLVTTVILFLTEITSNTATAAAFLPLLGPVAVSLDTSAAMLVIPAAVAASCAFMMPVATPPNAIVFASGKLKIIDMVKAGLVLNLASILFITLAVLYLAAYIFDF